MLTTLRSSEEPETSSLRAWRERALDALLRIGLAIGLLPMLVDTAGSFQRGQIEHVAFNITFYVIVLVFTFVRPLSFRLRVLILLGLGLGFNCYILMSVGLTSAGRVNVVAIVMLAALLLGRRPAITAWLLGALGVGLSLACFPLQPTEVIAAAAARLVDPNTLLTQALITVGLSAFLASLALWLLDGLSSSLHIAEQALIERDQLNATLERRVAEHTAQLEQALASLHASEVKYKALFQSMPAVVTVTDSYGQPLERNMVAQHLLGTTGAAAQIIRPDGSAMPPEEHPGMRAIQERRVIGDIEVGLSCPGGDTSWYSVTAVPLDLPGYGAMVVSNDITARKAADQALKRQLQMQAAIVRSSQILLGPASVDADQQHLLTAALETLYAATTVSPIYLLRNVDDPQDGLSAQIIARVAPAALAPLRAPHVAWQNLPAGVRQSLASGDVWLGPIQGLLPPLPWLHALFEEQEIRSLLCFPIFVDRLWWGAIFFADPEPNRVWGAHETLLLRTIAEMIGTTLRRWKAEASLSQQLRYAEALAHCSQLLLDQGGGPASRETLTRSVLDALGEAIGASHMLVYQHLDGPAAGLPYNILAVSQAPGVSPLILPGPDQIADIPAELAALIDAGHAFNGPVVGRFPDNPRFQEAFDQNGVQSALIIPLAFDGKPWGIMEATDCAQARTWDAPRVQLLRTAAEMLATAQQGWEATRTLAEREHFIQRVMHATPDIIYVFDLNTQRTVYINRPLTMLASYTREQIDIDSALARELLLDAEDQSRMAEHYRRLAAAAAGTMLAFEYRVRLADGRVRYVLSRDQIFQHDEGGRPRQILCLAQDITERRLATEALLRAKEAAEAADKAKSTFLAHMSHEIRTPLTAIIGMASLLFESPLTSSQRESAAIIRTGGETLLSLIGNILDFSKIEAGQLDLAAQPFDLPAVCRAAVDLVAHAAARKGLSLTLNIPPDLPARVIGDDGRLRQVLVNLLSNAVKFTQNGAVWLTLSSRPLDADSCEIQLVVRDTGIGIPPAQLDQIFKPFVQVDHMLTRQEGGTGLGLAISQHLARLMDGRLDVESTFGIGTTFTLTLPVGVAPALPESPQPRPAPGPIMALRVLVAEDNLVNQEVLQRMLDQLGVVPTMVGDGEAALSAVRAVPYDLVLMDIQMPVMDGETAARQIRALGSAINQPYIIALTASALRGDRERYLGAGMNDYLSKPVQLEDLHRVLSPLARAAAPLPPPSAELREGLSGAASPAELLNWPAVERLLASFQLPTLRAAALVYDLYERELLAQISATAEAVGADGRPQVARLAHKLRGGSQQLGATALAAACTALEAAARSPDRPDLAGLLVEVRRIYQLTQELLHERIQMLNAEC